VNAKDSALLEGVDSQDARHPIMVVNPPPPSDQQLLYPSPALCHITPIIKKIKRIKHN